MELNAGAAARRLSVSRSAIIVWSGVALTVALHLTFSNLYGYQRDELYFIACARRLAWGYVDQPPLIAFITKLVLRLFGDSLVGLRIVPILASGALVALAARLVERFGGGTFAQIAAMTGIALAPFDLAVGNLLTMNAFEPLFWLGLTVLIVEQAQRPRMWRWTAIGLVVGVGFLNKWSMAIYAAALLGGILLSPARRTFAVRGLGVGIAVAALIAAPNVLWQAAHDWSQIQVLHNADAAKNEHVAPLLFLVEQLPLMNPCCAPLWIAGLLWLARARRFAGIAIAYALVLAFEFAMHGKVYYVAPIYPALIAAGAVAIEMVTRKRAAVRFALIGAILAGGLAIMPLATPALPLPALLAYQHMLDVRTLKMEHHPTGLVPQQFADQLGWDDLEATIARVANMLPARERVTAAVLTNDYGQAAALDFLGRRDALPPAISGHNQYYLWGPRGEHPAIIAVGVSRELLAREYRSIEQVATYRSAFVLPQNTDLPVYVCRDPRMPLARFWPQLRRYV